VLSGLAEGDVYTFDAELADGAATFGPGRPGAVKRPKRFPSEICCARGFCMGAQGA
jgi:hypothetical protein